MQLQGTLGVVNLEEEASLNDIQHCYLVNLIIDLRAARKHDIVDLVVLSGVVICFLYRLLSLERPIIRILY
jgi:hypothetical protein